MLRLFYTVRRRVLRFAARMLRIGGVDANDSRPAPGIGCMGGMRRCLFVAAHVYKYKLNNELVQTRTNSD